MFIKLHKQNVDTIICALYKDNLLVKKRREKMQWN